MHVRGEGEVERGAPHVTPRKIFKNLESKCNKTHNRRPLVFLTTLLKKFKNDCGLTLDNANGRRNAD
jgi:hypothetical protein